jgi:hypothetical protein
LNTAIPRLETIIEYTQETMEIMRILPVIASDLDTCIPGPDIGWETRLADYVRQRTKGLQKRTGSDKARDEDEAAMLGAIEVRLDPAIADTKLMIGNPLQNMPGSTEAYLTNQSVSQKTNQFNQYLNQLVAYQEAMNSLGVVRSQVKSSAANYLHQPTELAALTPAQKQVMQTKRGLTLFTDEWNSKTQAEKDMLYTMSLGRFPQSVLLNTIGDNVARDQEMQNRVFVYQWDLWEELMDQDEVTKKQKQLLYVQLHEMRSQIPSQAQVIQAETLKNQSIQDIQSLGEKADACLLLRTIFVKALYPGNTPDLRYIQIDRIMSPENKLIERVVPITDVDAATLNTAAIRLANRQYTQTELSGLKESLAQAIPSQSAKLRSLLSKPSILDATDNDISSWRAENIFGEDYQTDRIIAGFVNPSNSSAAYKAITLKEVLRRDTRGELFCSLPYKYFQQNVEGAEKWDQMRCNPLDNDPSGVVGVWNIFSIAADKKQNAERKRSVDIIAEGGSNPVRDTRKAYMEIPLNWYFSIGASDYMKFE